MKIYNILQNGVVLIILMVQMSYGWYPKQLSTVLTPDVLTHENRIVGGIPADAGEFKGIVSIQHIAGFHYCGGSVITPFYVLTAAHCLLYEGELIFTKENIMIIGDTLNVQVPELKRQIKYVADIIPHPNYDEFTSFADIGILKLLEPFSSTVTFSSVLLSTATPVTNQNCSVAGWGVLEYEQELISSILLKVDINIINTNICNISYNGYIPDNMICAGYMPGGKDSCQGDSGGPLMCGDYLCGIVSFGYGCAVANYPGVYTDVSKYYNWIELILNDNSTSTSTTYSTVPTIPIANSTIPIANTTVPVANTTVPIANTTVSIADTTVPIANTTVPVANTTQPNVETTTNSTEIPTTTVPSSAITLRYSLIKIISIIAIINYKL